MSGPYDDIEEHWAMWGDDEPDDEIPLHEDQAELFEAGAYEEPEGKDHRA